MILLTTRSETTLKNLFNARAPSFDAKAINQTIQRALASAVLDTQAGLMRDVSDTILRAPGSGRVGETAPRFEAETAIEVAAHLGLVGDGETALPRLDPSNGKASQRPGSFEAREFSTGAGTRAYKTYVPAGTSAGPRAMVVMLHGGSMPFRVEVDL